MRAMLVPFLLLMLAAPASAAEWKADDPSNRKVVDVGLETVRAVLAQAGAVEKPSPSPEPGTILARFPNGMTIILSLEHCEGAGKKCGRLLLMSFVEPGSGWDEGRLKDALLNHTSGYHFVTVGFVAGPKSPVITARSINSAYGMPRGQLYLDLTDFAMSVKQVRDLVGAPGAAK